MDPINELLDNCKTVCGAKTDTALADALHVSKQTVWGWRNQNKVPDIVTCARIAEITGIPVVRVLGTVNEARALSSKEKAIWRKIASAAAVVVMVCGTLPVWAHASTASASLNAGIHIHYANLRAAFRKLNRRLGRVLKPDRPAYTVAA